MIVRSVYPPVQTFCFPQRRDKWIKSAAQQQKQRYHQSHSHGQLHQRKTLISCFLFPHQALFKSLLHPVKCIHQPEHITALQHATDLSPLWVCWQDFLMLPHYCCMGQIGPRDSWAWRDWCWTSQTPHFCSVVNWSLNLNQTAPYPPRAAANTTGCAGGPRPQLPCLHHEACGHDGGGACVRGGDALLDGEGLA